MSTNRVNGHDEGHEEADVLEVDEDGGGLDVVDVSTEDAAFAGHLDWHSMECVTPKLRAFLECGLR